jgi:Ca2+-binding EF-hand superfamily protein
MSHPRSRHLLVAGLMTVGFAGSPPAQANKDQGGGGVEHQLQMMDTDGDGKISAGEHAAGAKKMFEMMDADKNGKVTAAEMEAAHQQVTGNKAGPTELGAAEKIKMIDTNHDGVLSAEEHADGAKKMFEKMDTNKDGFLSKSELAAGHARMMHQGPKDKPAKDQP